MIAAMQMYNRKVTFKVGTARVTAITDASVRSSSWTGKPKMGSKDSGMQTAATISMIRNARWSTFLHMVRISL